MTKAKQSQTNQQTNPVTNVPDSRLILAFILPIVGGLLLNFVALRLSTARNGSAPLFAGLGVTSWLLGLRWYGLPALGLRGKRPLLGVRLARRLERLRCLEIP